jgi:hypothetical protein
MAEGIMGDIIGQHKVAFGERPKVHLVVKGGFGLPFFFFIVM